MNRTDTGFKGQCLACRHWTLKVKDDNGDYRAHGMAQHHMGFCANEVEWRYFGGRHQCHNGKFTAVEEQIFLKRMQWLEKRN